MKTIEFHDCKMAYQTAGRPEGLPVLLLHGNSTGSQLFTKQLSEGIPDLYLIAPNFPGHGASDTPEEPALYTIQSFAEQVHKLIESLEIQDFIVYGASLGGHVAMELAAIAKNIKGLVTSGSPALPLPLDMASYFAADPVMGIPFKEDVTEEEAEQWANACVYQNTEAKNLVKDIMLSTSGVFRKNMATNIMQGIGISDQKAIIEKLDIPVAILHGEQEWLVKKEPFEILKLENPFDSGVIIVPECGHLPPLENSVFLGDLLKQFAHHCLNQS